MIVQHPVPRARSAPRFGAIRRRKIGPCLAVTKLLYIFIFYVTKMLRLKHNDKCLRRTSKIAISLKIGNVFCPRQIYFLSFYSRFSL